LPPVVRQVIETLNVAVGGGTAPLIAEQSVAFLEFADRGCPIESGRVRPSGGRTEPIESDAVKSAYFGISSTDRLRLAALASQRRTRSNSEAIA
jgi:ABC-type branched-subunit amino acid transport system ATPase component